MLTTLLKAKNKFVKLLNANLTVEDCSSDFPSINHSLSTFLGYRNVDDSIFNRISFLCYNFKAMKCVYHCQVFSDTGILLIIEGLHPVCPKEFIMVLHLYRQTRVTAMALCNLFGALNDCSKHFTSEWNILSFVFPYDTNKRH